MSISLKIQESIEKSSWIRKMFEEGAKLKAEFGAENVYDFSLGNPDLEPPAEFFQALKQMANSTVAGVHGYMPNTGFTDVRNSISLKVEKDHKLKIDGNSIVMTCGAAGGMNIVLKTILDPGDEIIAIKPYFAEYGFYVSNHQGVLVLVDSNSDFSINIDAIEKAITPKTKGIIINSPNNPTGKIYTEKEIDKLCEMLKKKSSGDRKIFLICDEPYREIVYDNRAVSPVLSKYAYTLVINSYSKSLSLPGERIGYVAISPDADNHALLMAGLNLSNRILGFVNAPALMQRIVAQLNETAVNVNIYKRRRDIFMSGLKEAGYEFTEPEGAFYLFCKSPGGDDVKFVRHLQKYNILAVPGVGFGGPGYFRIAYCISEKVIERSIPKFKEAIASFK
ncbi:MAG TPA: pyridoxal phosphate-dependent aminotransferase [Spirochaetota bacterium]|nr:pyridoxal phosphate-dependent aminotransferase [Spirochaetota bacterium]HPS87324.1 pyridoxal phosphate-dependent aminotransferase [Spirochaetota bacterium]